MQEATAQVTQPNPARLVSLTAVALFSAALMAAAWWGWIPIPPVEAAGFVTGAVCVWLVTQGNIWNWPIGLLNNVCFAALFWQSRLFADAGLQVIYFALGIYGWRMWLHGGDRGSRLPVSRATRMEWYGLVIFLIAGTVLLRWLLIKVQGAAPFWDAATTILCLCAQILLCRKRLENWWFWIAADLIYVPLYFTRELFLTSALYGGFLVLCLYGQRQWRRELARNEVT